MNTIWIHCNQCSVTYQKNIKLYLTECAHVFCEKCVQKINETKYCLVCSKCTLVMQISKEMDEMVQQFFVPPELSLKKALEIYEFQSQQKNRLLQTMFQKYNYAKKECIKTLNHFHKLQKENKMLGDALKSIGMSPYQVLTHTPNVNSVHSNASIPSNNLVVPIPKSGHCYKNHTPYPQNTVRSGNFVNSSLKYVTPLRQFESRFLVPIHQKHQLSTSGTSFEKQFRSMPSISSVTSTEIRRDGKDKKCS